MSDIVLPYLVIAIFFSDQTAVLHSALKLEKKFNFKSTKHIICIFKNGKKSIFAPEKSLKLAKMQFFDFFLVQKLSFGHF